MLVWAQEADDQLLISAPLCNVDYKISYLGSEPPLARQNYKVLLSSISGPNWQNVIPLNTHLVVRQLVPLCLGRTADGNHIPEHPLTS